eukprot:1654978-Amphidinium_carterae.1
MKSKLFRSTIFNLLKWWGTEGGARVVSCSCFWRLLVSEFLLGGVRSVECLRSSHLLEARRQLHGVLCSSAVPHMEVKQRLCAQQSHTHSSSLLLVCYHHYHYSHAASPTASSTSTATVSTTATTARPLPVGSAGKLLCNAI